MDDRVFLLLLLLLLPSVACELSMSGGERHSCAAYNGRVWCWGRGDQGVLGQGNTADVGDEEGELGLLLPVPLDGHVVQVHAGTLTNCALFDHGGVRCWGQAVEGVLALDQAGDDQGDAEGELAALSDIVFASTLPVLLLSHDHTHACALFADAALRCWGRGDEGQLGTDDSEDVGNGGAGGSVAALPPIVFADTVPVAVIATGFRTSCAVFSNGRVRCWGGGGWSVLGYGLPEETRLGDEPGEMAALGYIPFSDTIPAVDIEIGFQSMCTLFANGRLRCWGTNFNGNLGTDDGAQVGNVAGQMEALDYITFSSTDRATKVAMGWRNTCAIFAAPTTSRVRCWGIAANGVLGMASSSGNIGDQAGEMSTLDYLAFTTTSELVSVSMGSYHACAVFSIEEGMRCWGRGNEGRLGSGSTDAVTDVQLTSAPRYPQCGDGTPNFYECDDSNAVDDDGCSMCIKDPGAICNDDATSCVPSCANTGGILNLPFNLNLKDATTADSVFDQCTHNTGGVIDLNFDSDTVMTPHPDLVEAEYLQIYGSAMAQDPCEIFPNLERVNARLHVSGVMTTLICPNLVDVNLFHVQQNSVMTDIVLAREDLVIQNLFLNDLTALSNLVLGEFEPTAGKGSFSMQSSVIFAGPFALSLPPGTGLVVRVADKLVHGRPKLGLDQTTFAFVDFAVEGNSRGSPNTQLAIEVVDNGAIEWVHVDMGGSMTPMDVAIRNNAALRVVSLDGDFEVDGAYPEFEGVVVRDNPVLEVLATTTKWKTFDRLSTTVSGNSASLCCSDLSPQPFRKWLPFHACSKDTCSSCGGVAELSGPYCKPCQCPDGECVDLGSRRGSHTVCTSEALRVSDAARPSLCLDGKSVASEGAMHGDSVRAGKMVVAKRFVLAPTALGECTAADEGMLRVDDVTQLLHECVLGEWNASW